jgi:hypothetical protein
LINKSDPNRLLNWQTCTSTRGGGIYTMSVFVCLADDIEEAVRIIIAAHRAVL